MLFLSTTLGDNAMTAYAVGILRVAEITDAIVAYLERIDATLAPYQGRFIIHGGPQEIREGAHLGDLIVIAFPDRARAAAWYEGPEYAEILPLRTGAATGTVFLIDGVPPTHRATDILVRAAG